MLIKTNTVFFMVLIVLCGTQAVCADDDWTLVVEKNDIRVYRRTHSETDIREYRSEMVLEEDILCVSAVMSDIPAAVEWFPYCRFAKLIDETADGKKTIINIADLPWPFQDRYAVFSFQISADTSQKQIIIDFGVDEDSLNRDVGTLVDTDSMVKVTFMKGRWTLTMLDRNKTKLTYLVFADVGGHFPAWLMTTLFDKAPYKTLENLKVMVKKPRYQQQSLSKQATVFSESRKRP